MIMKVIVAVKIGTITFPFPTMICILTPIYSSFEPGPTEDCSPLTLRENATDAEYLK